MRITGGRAKGIQLAVPEDAEFLRPATDYMREAVFSSIKGRSVNAFFLDLFAGIGSYGLEAASRGASAGIFIEKNQKFAQTIDENLKRVKKATQREPACKIICQDVFEAAGQISAEFDLIFIDPPYNMLDERGEEILTIFSTFLKKGDSGRLLLEVPAHYKTPSIRGLVEIRRLGRIAVANHPNVIIYMRV
ncbi:MAG: RsmD family RNA methyltransferase [Puniceicoccales bacterium]|jgi:16S rRNA (guanine966-N2)-methyltransferase|nr:RsmD family RNA methyltransferase [Puniceicoccales bacterium]